MNRPLATALSLGVSDNADKSPPTSGERKPLGRQGTQPVAGCHCGVQPIYLDKRTVMRFDPRLAPVKAAVLPLSRNPELSPKARDLAAALRRRWQVEFDDAGAIGRRYRRQDEIGTPFCVTVDFDTLTDDAVTVRDRDTMAQERIPLDAVERYLVERLPAC